MTGDAEWPECAPQDWPEGWCGLVEGQAAAFEAELARELAPGHPLARALAEGRVRAVGVARGSDDVVFAVKGEKAPFAVVHLAWPEPEPRSWWRLGRRRRPGPVVHPLARIADLD